MELTQEHLQVAFNAWAAAQDGGGVVLEDPGLYPVAHALSEAGWLRRGFAGDELAWFWTDAAEHALDVNGLLQAAAGREN
jgi:hypothetical protein